jgi:hypothetical protein
MMASLNKGGLVSSSALFKVAAIWKNLKSEEVAKREFQKSL